MATEPFLDQIFKVHNIERELGPECQKKVNVKNAAIDDRETEARQCAKFERHFSDREDIEFKETMKGAQKSWNSMVL